MLVLVWESVTKETIINCFSKASISKDLERAAFNDYDDPSKGFTSNNLLNINKSSVCTESFLTDDKIIDKFTMNEDGDWSGDNNKDDEVQMIKLMKTSISGSIDTLRTCTMFDDEHEDDICSYFDVTKTKRCLVL